MCYIAFLLKPKVVWAFIDLEKYSLTDAVAVLVFFSSHSFWLFFVVVVVFN